MCVCVVYIHVHVYMYYMYTMFSMLFFAVCCVPVSGDPPSRGAGMPERCRFWPNCKKGDSCPFHHPSAQCRYVIQCSCMMVSSAQCRYVIQCSCMMVSSAQCRYMYIIQCSCIMVFSVWDTPCMYHARAVLHCKNHDTADYVAVL